MDTPKRDRGGILALKLLIPERVYRIATRPVSWMLLKVPQSMLYRAGLKARAGRYPYKLIRDGDVVFQIGAPRDLLGVGRSRSAYFMHLVKGGKLVVMEPDPENVKSLREFVEKFGFTDQVIIVDKGAWSSDDELVFLSSPLHPASNLIEGTEEITDEEMKRRDYQRIHVPVTTVDNVVEKFGLACPRLISITANGSESEILKGMKQTINSGLPYISLAITGQKYPEMMSDYGYDVVAFDDRGYTFGQRNQAEELSA